MKSRISIEPYQGAPGTFKPVIQVNFQHSEDARDSLVRGFLNNFGGNDLCRVFVHHTSTEAEHKVILDPINQYDIPKLLTELAQDAYYQYAMRERQNEQFGPDTHFIDPNIVELLELIKPWLQKQVGFNYPNPEPSNAIAPKAI